MSEKIRHLHKMLNYLLENEDEEEYEIFFYLIKKIKYGYGVFEYRKEEFEQNLIKFLPQVKENYNRASIIEIIVESDYLDYCNKHYIQELYNQYMMCIVERAVDRNDMNTCLSAFIRLGIDPNTIVNELQKGVEIDCLVNIFSKLYPALSDGLVELQPSEREEVKVAYCLNQRSGIIAQFLLLVHPHIRKYAGISEIVFLYSSHIGVYDDCWPRGLLPNRKEELLELNILSWREIEVLEKLELLINAGQLELNSNEVEVLYDEFFKNEDPFKVIFTLPSD